MSNIPKDKFLKEFDQYQEENGMWGGKRFTKADNEKWQANQPLTAEQQIALEKRDKKGFIVLVVGGTVLLIGAIVICMMQS